MKVALTYQTEEDAKEADVKVRAQASNDLLKLIEDTSVGVDPRDVVFDKGGERR